MGLSVAQANLDTERIAGLVVAKAGAGDEMFRKGTFGGRMLRCLVRKAPTRTPSSTAISRP